MFIDCSPSLGYTTVNILTAADTVLIPVQCEYLALEGLSKLLNTIRKVKSGLNPDLDIEGFLLTMYMRNRLNNQVVTEVREHFGRPGLRHNNPAQHPFGRSALAWKTRHALRRRGRRFGKLPALAREFLKRNRKRSK